MTSQGVGKVLKQIPNLEFVSNLGDFSNIADDAGAGRKGGLREYARRVGRAQPTINDWVNAARVIKKTERISVQFFDKTQHLAAIHAAPQELASVELGKGGAGRKGGVSEYARRIGRAQQTIMEWVNAAAVLKNLPDIRHLFDRTYHLAAIHAAQQVGRAQQRVMEWVNAASVATITDRLTYQLFDLTTHLAAIHAAR